VGPKVPAIAGDVVEDRDAVVVLIAWQPHECDARGQQSLAGEGRQIATWSGEDGDELYVDKPVGVAVVEDGSIHFMQYNERSLEKLSVEEIPT
jgi:hypothetical protein